MKDINAHITASSALLKRGIKEGDIISVAKENDNAIIRICEYTRRRHVVICFDSVIHNNIEPRFILISFAKYRGPALKGYLKDQSHQGEIKKVKITSRYPNSCYCEVI